MTLNVLILNKLSQTLVRSGWTFLREFAGLDPAAIITDLVLKVDEVVILLFD